MDSIAVLAGFTVGAIVGPTGVAVRHATPGRVARDLSTPLRVGSLPGLCRVTAGLKVIH